MKTLMEVSSTNPYARPPRPGREYSDSDLRQFVEGFLAIVNESVAGTGNAARTIYFETAIPALLSDGETSESLSYFMSAWAVSFSHEILHEVGAELRGEAKQWLADFVGRYVAELVRTGERLGAKV